MAKYTSAEVVESNLRQAWDEDYYNYIRQRIRFTLGEKFDRGTAMSSALSGEIPDDVDILPRFYEPGQSRRILTNAFQMAAKVCYTVPDPDYPDAPSLKELVTKAFNRALWKGMTGLGSDRFTGNGGWKAHAQRCFMDGDGLGTGFVQIGVVDGRTTIQHHPLSRVIWDRHHLGVSDAKYVAFVHHLSEDEAVDMFGSSILKRVQNDTSGKPSSLRVVKALQYFDMGSKKSNPTEMWRLGTLGGEILDVGENKYGCLPFAHMELVHFWGMRRHMGRIDFQIPDQVLRNAYERYMRLTLERGPGFDAVDTGKMDPEDQEAFEGGELLPAVRFQVPPLGKIGDYIQRYPAQEVPQTVYKGLEYLDRMDPGQSGISDADRANVTSSPRTLGEIEQVQSGANDQQNWSQRAYADFLSELFYKVNYISAKMHTAPMALFIKPGVPFVVNDPANPRSNLSFWLDHNTWPEVNEDALVKNSPMRKAQIAQGKWTQFLQDPLMNPIEVRRALLEGFGEKDPDKYINPQAVAMTQGGMGIGGDPMASGIGAQPQAVDASQAQPAA